MVCRLLPLTRLRCLGVLLAFSAALCANVPAEGIDDAALKAADGDRLAGDLYVLRGAVNTGVLVHGDSALLFDCCDSVTPERLAKLGVKSVEAVYFTQFRRPNTAGGYAMAKAGAALHGPAGERDCFEKADEYWADEKNHWHLYQFRPGSQVPSRSMPLAGVVRGGDSFEWNGHAVSVLDTPGMTDGAVSYRVKAGEKTWLFCGDVMSAPGQVWELYSLQKGVKKLRDYHGFLGAHDALLESVGRIRDAAPSDMVPSHGAPFPFTNEALDLLQQRFGDLWGNYVAISAVNFYFPQVTEDMENDPRRMIPSPRTPIPDWVQKVIDTSFIVVSDAGPVLLVDCGACPLQKLLETIDQSRGKKRTVVDACWITHYHDDHTQEDYGLAKAGIPLLCEAGMAPILEHPERYLLPCLPQYPAPVTRVLKDGEIWKWQEFTLTAFHFPGQTLYHGGLLVEGHGKKVFFAGDSLSPTGVDDYCTGNRNFLGPGLGMRRCFDILRQTQPDYILNQHQGKAFSFTADQLNQMEAVLAERQDLVEKMTPWENANFALDEHWVRTAPYEQEMDRGTKCTLDVEFTNHGKHASHARANAVLPAAWRACAEGPLETDVPARTSGLSGPDVANPDGALRLCVECPADAAPGLRVIPVQIWWDGRYLGQIVHGLVRVR